MTEPTTDVAESVTQPESSNSRDKFSGLIKKSSIKVLTHDLVDLFTYAYSVAPPFRTMHIVVSIFRLMQFGGAALCAGWNDLWKSSDKSNQVNGYLSIAYYLIPPVVHDNVIKWYLSVAYIGVTVLAIALLVLASRYYKRNASLPTATAYLIAIYFGVIVNLLHNIVFASGFGYLPYVFVADGLSAAEKVGGVLPILLALLECVSVSRVGLQLASQALIFAPVSWMAVCPSVQTFAFISQTIPTVVLALGSHLGKTARLVLLVIAAVIYLASISIQFAWGGFVREKESLAFMATAATSGLYCIILAVLVGLDKHATLVVLLVYPMLFLVCFLLAYLTMTKIQTRNLNVLEEISDRPDEFARIRSVNDWINLTVTGFREAHMLCLSWDFLQAASDKWPDSEMMWFVHAKFVAIYPEETTRLDWIRRMIISRKVKGTWASAVKSQTAALMEHREQHLSPTVRTKIAKLSKNLTISKQKLRHVWDLAIQSNTSDMENSTVAVVNAVDKTEAEIKHVMRQFPNNRFVTRQYARFCREVKADQKTYEEMIAKTQLLSRGLTVAHDQAHIYGLDVFALLPDKLMTGPVESQYSCPDNGLSLGPNVYETDEVTETMADDEYQTILDRIEHLKVPSTAVCCMAPIACFLILFTVPFIIAMIMIPKHREAIIEPLVHLTTMASMRSLITQVFGFGYRTAYEKIGFMNPAPAMTDTLPVHVGSTWDTGEQTAFFCREAMVVLQQLEEFRGYSSKGEKIDQAKQLLFGSSLTYTYYDDVLTESQRQITLPSGISDMVYLQQPIIEALTLPVYPNYAQTPNMMTPMANIVNITDLLSDVLTLMADYVKTEGENIVKLLNILVIVMPIIAFVLIVVIGLTVLTWMNRDKESVYRCLTSLPKNVLSGLADNLRVLKKESDNDSSLTNGSSNSDVSKQEDNIMKVLAAASTGHSSRSKWGDMVVISLVIFLAVWAVAIELAILLVKKMSSTTAEIAPQANFASGAYSYGFGTLIQAAQITFLSPTLQALGFGCPLYTFDRCYGLLAKYSKASKSYFAQAQFGQFGEKTAPYDGFEQSMEDARPKFVCDNQLVMPIAWIDAMSCYSIDMIYTVFESIINQQTHIFLQVPSIYMKMDGINVALWGFMISPLYEYFFAPMLESVVAVARNELRSEQDYYTNILIVLFCLDFVVAVLATLIFVSVTNHLKAVLRLLLHCPSQIILQNRRIMAVLSGDFSRPKGDGTTRDAEFFHAVVNNFPDGVITTDLELSIVSSNKACERILGVTEVNCIGRSIAGLLSSDNGFSGNSQNLVNQAMSSNSTTERMILYTQGGELHLDVSAITVAQRMAFVFRDVTQTVRYNTLIQAERAKSDALLASILPPSLVARVHAGEKDISFAVRCATLTFMDIVSFTPWCGSSSAERVMMILNLMYRRFDAALATYPRMTKIKCIGDCYMAAAGVFDEVLAPAAQAKEVVSFGLDALDIIRALDAETGESLEIRVGVNTGGPIVAGVLGIGKPTFEILGPAINMAQQMEHKGVPMQVHISRSVYELIYGEGFVVKERGSIEVRNQTVLTYLVSGRNATTNGNGNQQQ